MSRLLKMLFALAAMMIAAGASMNAQGKIWEKIDPRSGNVRVAVDHNGTLFATKCGYNRSSSDLSVWRSVDNGTSWTRLTNYPGHMFVRTMFVAPNGSLFIAGDYAAFRTEDAGDSWTPVFTGLTHQTSGNDFPQIIFSFAVLPGGTLLAGTNDALFRSIDNGDHWQATTMEVPQGSTINSIVVLNANDMLVSSYSGAYRTNDGGVTWVLSDTGLLDSELTTMMVDRHGNVYAGGIGNGVTRSTDGGRTWNDMDNGLKDRLIEKLELDSTGAVCVVTERDGVMRYDEENIRWIPIGSGLPKYAEIRSLAIGRDGHMFAGSDSSCYRLAEPASVDAGPVADLTSGASLDAAPNPARGMVAITADLPSATTGEITLYASDGKRVAVLAAGRMAAGRSMFTFDASNVAAGVYRCVLRTGMSIVSLPVEVVR